MFHTLTEKSAEPESKNSFEISGARKQVILSLCPSSTLVCFSGRLNDSNGVIRITPSCMKVKDRNQQEKKKRKKEKKKKRKRKRKRKKKKKKKKKKEKEKEKKKKKKRKKKLNGRMKGYDILEQTTFV